MLFTRTIDGWAGWAKVYQSLEAFRPVIPAMLEMAGLPGDLEPEKLTPGTNAVFGVGDYVIKIFAPEQSGLQPWIDFDVETGWMRRAAVLGIPCPRLVHAGELQDKYLFYFLIMERIDGRDARDVMFAYTREQAADFVSQVEKAVAAMAGQPWEPARIDLGKQTRENTRWRFVHPDLKEQLLERASALDLSRGVMVHGDLTGENVLVRPDGSIAVIDFADSTVAPPCYELPPLLFELFRLERPDRLFVKPFLAGRDREQVLSDLLDGLSIHDFGGDILREYFTRRQVDGQAVRSIPQLEKLLRCHL